MAKSDSKLTSEIGVSGAHVHTGMQQEEFLPELRGHRAVKKYREMRDNDDVIGAILQAMDMLIRAVEWRVEAVDDTPEAQADAEFAESVLEDASHTFEDFISEVLSFLVYGWSFFEVVYKRREGPEQKDPSRRSKFDDGRLGIRKLAPRAQQTLQRWKLDHEGGVQAMVQQSGMGGAVEIPLEKGLLFRTVNASNSPSGRSVLRNAYRSYYYATHIENIEAIAIERELNGLPVGYIPGEYLRANAGSDKGKIRAEYEKMLRDVKFNEQGFIMLPSDTWPDSEGNPSSTPLVKIELLASSGTRNIETQPVIMRYRQAMARTVLADFIMLGTSERGSFALSKSKADLFLRSLEGYLNNIASTLNRHLISRLWKLNGLNPDTQPRLVPGDIAPVDLEELGQYVQRLSGSGFPIFPDEEVERSLLEAGGLPTEVRGDDDLIGRSDGE